MSRALASVDPISAYGSAIAARARAVELAPRSAVVRSVDALVSLWADRDAVRAGKLAEDALDSRDAAARAHQTLAWIAVRDGAFDDAEHQFNAAVAARPGCWGYHKAAMAVLHIRGDYERCARRCSELSSIEPEDPYVLAYYLESLNALGRYQAAVAVEAAAPPAAKDHAVLAAVIRARAKLGDIEGASRLARHFRGPAVCRAAVALSLGDVDAAWRELEAGAGEPNGMMLLVPTDPVFEPFWNEPRLAKILASAGH
jgi:Flp pilus assembly protein TadD